MRFVEVRERVRPTLLNIDRIISLSYQCLKHDNGEDKWIIYVDTDDSSCLYKFAEFSGDDGSTKIPKIMTALARWLNLPESESCRHTIARYDGADGVEEVK